MNWGSVSPWKKMIYLFHRNNHTLSSTPTQTTLPLFLNCFFLLQLQCLPFACMYLWSQTVPYFFLSLTYYYFRILISGLGLKLDPCTLSPHFWAVPLFAPFFLLSQVPNWLLGSVFYNPGPDLACRPFYNGKTIRFMHIDLKFKFCLLQAVWFQVNCLHLWGWVFIFLLSNGGTMVPALYPLPGGGGSIKRIKCKWSMWSS